MSFQGKMSINSCPKQVVKKNQPKGVSERAKKESAFGTGFLKSIENLHADYNAQLKRENITRVDELRDFQWNFWKLKATEVHVENAKVFVLMNKSRADFTPEDIEKCWNKITDFHVMLRLMNRDIRSDLERKDVDRKALTVLISVDAIQKFRCRKYLKGHQIKALANQSLGSKPTLTLSGKPSETGDLIKYHLREFLKLIHEHSNSAQ